MALPKVSAVMPVPSDTKKTVRFDMLAKISNAEVNKTPKISRLSTTVGSGFHHKNKQKSRTAPGSPVLTLEL
jgi:hypothetical protein